MTDRKRSKTEERSFARLLDELESQEADFERFKRNRSLIPPGWHSVENRAEVKPKKAKLTLSLDADMLKWFRDLGRGYQPRMNAILRAYMHGVISKEIERKGDRDWRGEMILGGPGMGRPKAAHSARRTLAGCPGHARRRRKG